MDDFTGNGNDLTASGIYMAPTSITTSGNWDIPANRQITILVDGDVDINNEIKVNDNNGFLMVIASGKITIDSSIGETPPSSGITGTTANVQGIFIADGNIEIPSSGSDDLHLWVGGTLISWSAITLERDIGGLASRTEPSMSFIYRPDFIANAPGYIKKVFYDWQQVPG